MNKKFILAMVFTVAVTMTGCAKGSIGSEGEAISKGESGTVEDINEKQYVYGKVKKIVGNEIELNIAKDPEVAIAKIDKEDKEDKKDGGKTEAASTTGAMKVGEDDKVSVGKIDKNEPLIDLEFTDKEKTIVVPTGLNINILSAAKGEGLSAIKEGSYLRIEVKDNTVENPELVAIDIIS